MPFLVLSGGRQNAFQKRAGFLPFWRLPEDHPPSCIDFPDFALRPGSSSYHLTALQTICALVADASGAHWEEA